MDSLSLLISPELGLTGLFASAFLSATLLPGGSEALLFALIRLHPDHLTLALLLATGGNTLGGLTTYGLGRLLPYRSQSRLSPRSLALLRRWGARGLGLSWLPLIGDALCLAAGWLRLPLQSSAGWMALGKGLRYGVIAWGAMG